MCTACTSTARSLDEPLAVAHRGTVLAARVEGCVLEAAGDDCQVAAPPTCVCARACSGCGLRVCMCARARARVCHICRAASARLCSRASQTRVCPTRRTPPGSGARVGKRGRGSEGGAGFGSRERPETIAVRWSTGAKCGESQRGAGAQGGREVEGRRGLVSAAASSRPFTAAPSTAAS